MEEDKNIKPATYKAAEFDPFELKQKVAPVKPTDFKVSKETREKQELFKPNYTSYDYAPEVFHKLGKEFKPWKGADDVFAMYNQVLQKENDAKASEQTVFGNAFRFLGKTATSFLGTVAATPGYMFALGEAALTDATLGEALENAWINGVENLEQSAENSSLLKTYVPTAVKEGGAWAKLTSSAYWADSVSDVVGMAAGLFLPGAAFKTLGIGKKIMSSAKWAGRVDDTMAAGFNTLIESSMEARETVRSVYASLQPKIESGEMTEEEARQISGEAAAGVFRDNVALLFVPNMIDQKWLFGANFNLKMLPKFNKNKNIVSRIDITDAGVSVKSASKFGTAYGYGSKMAAGLLKEGYFEEGGQYAIQKYEKNKALGLEDEENPFLGIAKTYLDSFDDAEFKESVMLGGLLGIGFGVVGERNENKNFNAMLNGEKAYKPNSTVAKMFRKVREEKKGIKQMMEESYITKYKSMNQLFEYKDGQIVLDEKTNKPKVDKNKVADFIVEQAKTDLRRYNVLRITEKIELFKANKLDTTELEASRDYWQSLDTYSTVQDYLAIPEGKEMLKKVLPEMAQKEAVLLEELTGEKVDANKLQETLLSSYDNLKGAYDAVADRFQSSLKVSKEKQLENPSFINDLFNQKIQNKLREDAYDKVIESIDAKITKYSGSKRESDKDIVAELEQEKESMKEEKKFILEHSKKLNTKEGQEELFESLNKGTKKATEAMTSAMNEEKVKAEANKIESFNHADIYKENTLVVSKDGKQNTYYGGVSITLENDSTDTYQILGINKGQLQVRDKDGKVVTLTKDNKINGQLIKNIEQAYPPKVTETVVTDTTVEVTEDNPEEVYDVNKNAEQEPHAPFTGSFTDFFRTKGNQELFEKNPEMYKPVLEFYKFIDNYDDSVSENSANYRTLKAFTLNTLPEAIFNSLPKKLQANLKQYPSAILTFVMYKNAFATSNGSYMFSFLPEPLINGDVESIGTEQFPLFSYKKYRELHPELTDEQITYDVQKAAERFTEIRESILNSIEPIEFKITGKNNGKKVESKEETSLVGKVVNTEAQLTEVDLFISNDIKDRGLVYVNHKGVKVPIIRQRLSESDIKKVVGLLQYYAGVTDEIEKKKVHRALSSIIHIVYQSKGKTNPSKYTFYPVEVADKITGFQYGEYFISAEDVLDGKVEHLEKSFLNDKYYSVDKVLLEESNAGKSFIDYEFLGGKLKETKYTGKGAYKKFLLSGENPRLKIKLAPLSETQFLNRSFNIEPVNQAILPMTKEEVRFVQEESAIVSPLTMDDEFNKLADQQGRETPNITIEDPDNLFKISKPSDIIGTSIEEMKWFRKTFPNFDLRFIPNGLIEGIGVAAVTSNMEVLITEHITVGTMYHEAFHVVSQFFTTPATRKRLYNEARQRTGKEFTDLQAEEFLADEFQDFMSNPKEYKFNKGEEVKKNIFERIWSALKSLFGVNTVEQMFTKIANGEYNKNEALNKPANFKYLYKVGSLDEASSQKLLEHYNVLFFDRLFNTNDFKAEALYDLTPEKINEVYTLVEKAISASQTPSIANKQILAHISDLKDTHKKFLKQYGFSYGVENIEDESKQTKDNSQFVESITRNVIDDMPSIIKLLVASLSQREANGTIYKDDSGFTKKVDFNATLNVLYRELANLPVEKIFPKLFQLANTNHPEFHNLLSRLGVTENQTIPNNASPKLVELQTEFLIEFQKNMNNVQMAILSKENKVFFSSPVNETREGKVIANWKNNIKASENPHFEFKEGNNWLIKDSEYTLPNGKKVGITKVHLEGDLNKTFPRLSDVQNYLKQFGITVSEHISKKNAINLIKFLSENLDKAEIAISSDDIFNRDITKVSKELKALAEEEATYSRDNFSNQWTNGKGSSEHAITLNSKMSNVINDLSNNSSTDYTPYSAENPNGNLQTAYTDWNTSELKMVLIRSVKPDFEDSIDLDQTKQGDFIVTELNSVLKGVSPFLRAADRSLEYGIDTTTPSSSDYSISQEAVVNELKNYLENEIIVALAYQNDKNAKSLVKSNRVNAELQFFKDILPKLNVKATATKYNYQEVAQGIIEENIVYIHGQLHSFVSRLTQENKKLFLDYNVVEKVGEEYVNNGIATELASKFSSTDRLSEGGLEQLTRTFTYLYTKNALEQVKYFMGTLGTYKKGTTDDFHKRTTTVVSTKRNTRNDVEYIHYLNLHEPRLDGYEHTEHYKDFVYDDLNVESSLNEYLSKQGITGYDKLNENDAQGWASMDGIKFLLKRSAKWTEGMEKTYQYEMQNFIYSNVYNDEKLLAKTKLSKERIDELFKEHLPEGWKGTPQYKGKAIEIEEMEAIPPQKPQGVGMIQNPNVKTFGAIQITKTSIAPLLPSNLEDSVGKELMLDMFINGIDFVLPKSAKKGEMLGNNLGMLPSLYKEDGSINTVSELLNQGYTTELISWSDIGIQLDIDSSGKAKVTQSTQMESLKTIDIYDKGESIEGYEDLLHLDLEDKRLKDKRKDKLFNALQKELGLQKDEEDNYSLVDPAKFKKVLQQEFERKTYSDNILQGINLVVDSELKIFDALNVSDRVDNLLTSIISNRLVKQKVNGDMLIQQASTLYEPTKRNVKSSNFLKSYEPEFNEAGELIKVNPAQCIISLPKAWIPLVQKQEGKTFEEKLKNFNKEIKADSWNKLLTTPSNRIPTQHLNSMEAMRIVKFLSPWSGSTIIVPSEIVVKAGSDFDVDKLTKYLNSYKFKNGKPQYLDVGTTEDRYIAYITESFFNYEEEGFLKQDKQQALDYYNQKINELTDRLYKSNLYKEITKEQLRAEVASIELEGLATDFEFLSFEEFSKTSLEEQLSIKQIDNMINQNSIQYILHPKNYISLMSPNGSENINKVADSIKKEKKESSLTDLLKFSTNMNYGFAQWKAASVLGTAANNTTFHAKVQKSPIKINTNLIKFHFPNIGNEFGGRLNESGELISVAKGEYVSAAVDAAKSAQPALTRANVTPSTGNLVMLLNELGLAEKNIFKFISSDIIKEFETLREVYEAKFLQIQGKSKFKSAVIEEVTNIPSKGQKKMLHNIFSEIVKGNPDFTQEMLDARWKEKVEDADITPNTTLELFLYYTEVAKHYGELVQLTKHDAGMAKNRDAVKNREERLNKLINTNLFNKEDINDLFTTTTLGGFRKMHLEGTKLFDSFFLQSADPKFSDFIYTALNPYKEAKVPEDRLISIQRKLVKKSIAYLLHTQSVNNEVLNERYNDLLFSKNNLAHRIYKLKNSNNPVADNLFIQELVPIISEYIQRTKENLPFDYVRRFSSKLTTFEEDSLNQSFKELMDNKDLEIQKLAKDTVYVSIIQSGLTKSNSSFFDTIPTEYFYPIAAEAIKSFQQSDFNVLNKDALKEIYQNSWMDKDLVKRQNAYVNGINILQDNDMNSITYGKITDQFLLKANFGNANYHFLTVELKGKAGDKVQFLFERGKLYEGKYIYNRIDKKGQGAKFFEINGINNPSMIKNNNYYKIDTTTENINEEEQEDAIYDELLKEKVVSLETMGKLQMQPDNIQKILEGTKTITNRTELLKDGIYSLPNKTLINITLLGQYKVNGSVVNKISEGEGLNQYSLNTFAKLEGFKGEVDFVENNKFSSNFIKGTQSRYVYAINLINTNKTITEEQLTNINNNLTKAGFRNITMEEFNNMSPERQDKAKKCYG